MTSEQVRPSDRQPIRANDLLRLIDANANRAGEGLRTLDDIARLVREDANTAEAIKQLRHELADCLRVIPRNGRLENRRTATDAGTEFTASGELQRTDWSAMVSAASERVLQSLRGLEEFGKAISAEAGESFKRLRYKAYDVLARAELRLAECRSLADAQLYLLIDASKPLDEFVAYLRRLAESGVDIFQIRDKLADGTVLMQYAKAAAAALADSTARFVVNDRVDIAIASGACGVHVGQEDLPFEDVQRIVPSGMLIGVSTHNLEQAVAAQSAGADYIGCGPTFPSQTKQFSNFAGTDFLREIASAIQIPAFAIGGVNQDNLDQVLDAGIARVAVSNVIHAADDPALTAKGLSKSLRAASRQVD